MAFPIPHDTRRPLPYQAGNCPPISVSFRAGKFAFSGFETEIVTELPFTCGTVTTYK
jgi:hypothetical protein